MSSQGIEDRHLAALHEAAHAVIALDRRLEIEVVSIAARSGRWIGRCPLNTPKAWRESSTGVYQNETERRRVFDAMVAAYSGKAIEESVTGEKAPPEHWETDSLLAQELTGRLAVGLVDQVSERDRAQQEAKHAVAAHRDGIDAFAELLEKKRTLTGKQAYSWWRDRTDLISS